MTGLPLRAVLVRQLDTASALLTYHLEGLSQEECLWQPAGKGPTVRCAQDGRWIATWPVDERYESGPPGIGWISWHIRMWWSMAIDHNFGSGTLQPETVEWPGSPDAVRAALGELLRDWRAQIDRLDDADLCVPDRTRWPFSDRSLADLIAWANLELTKNAAEIGVARFLYAARAVN